MVLGVKVVDAPAWLQGAEDGTKDAEGDTVGASATEVARKLKKKSGQRKLPVGNSAEARRKGTACLPPSFPSS